MKQQLTTFRRTLATAAALSVANMAFGVVILGTKVSSTDASVQSDEHPLSLIVDGKFTGNDYWSSYAGQDKYGEYQYVELNWSYNATITTSTIYWAVDGDSIQLPTEFYIMTWDGHEWQREELEFEGFDAANRSVTKQVFTANRLRIYMKSDKACGIKEVRLVGELDETCQMATLTDNNASQYYMGEPLTLSPTVTVDDGDLSQLIWNWTSEKEIVSTTDELTVTAPGVYTVTCQRPCGSIASLTYTIKDPNVTFTWPDYQSTLCYNYRYDYPEGVPAPTKMLPEDVGQVGVKTYGWWAFAWGKNRNAYVTDEAIDGLLKKMDEDFGYFRNTLGWLPDKRARRGYYSTIYLYGSGLYTDNADSLARGGWQGATWYKNESWPMIHLSYYPVACFDPDFTYCKYGDPQNGISLIGNVTDQVGQQNACVHEGIHAVFADLEGCKNAAWFQESGNTSMQADAELSKTPNAVPSSMGFLSGSNMIAPFQPIECYSGWLQDGSFGGPSAEGVNMFNSSGAQLCTWRNLLGGNQYGELFAHFLSVRFGDGALPWVWRYCKNRVLDGIADSIGGDETRRLIMEFRAKQATIEFGKWTAASRALLTSNWLINIKPEGNTAGGNWLTNVETWKATCYAKMSKCDEVDSAGWWKPEYRTTPGWSGSNIVPIHVSGNKGDLVKIHFKPLGQNMTCQLCFRTKRGRCYYSEPVVGEGDVMMILPDAPANKVLFAVVCNTDYIYTGEAQRKTHYDYRLQMLDNAYMPGNEQLKWFNYTSTITDNNFVAGFNNELADQEQGTTFGLQAAQTKVRAGEILPLTFTGASTWQVQVRMFSANGAMVYAQSLLRDGGFSIPANTAPGLYVLQAVSGSDKAAIKIVVE